MDDSSSRGDVPLDKSPEKTNSKACVFKMGVKRKFINRESNMRRKLTKSDSSSSDCSDSDDESVVRPMKTQKQNPFRQTTAFPGKIKTHIKDPKDVCSHKKNVHEDRSAKGRHGATAQLEIDTEADRDSRAIFEKQLQMTKEFGTSNEKLYRGMAGYNMYVEKIDTAAGSAGSAAVRIGPVRAPSNIRVTTRWDYQPDICKDYKETGFCGFGDSCKFLHDRSDYKFGWQLEKEYEDANKLKNEQEKQQISALMDIRQLEDRSTRPEDNLPFACLICRNKFVEPVQTKCQHYFCSKCALDHYRNSSTRCFACGNQTYGLFNPAKNIEKLMKKEQDVGSSYGSDLFDKNYLPSEYRDPNCCSDDNDSRSDIILRVIEQNDDSDAGDVMYDEEHHASEDEIE